MDYKNYKVEELENILKKLETSNNKEDKKKYKEIDLYLCSLDNKRYEKIYEKR